jgi:hypothetical protein
VKKKYRERRDAAQEDYEEYSLGEAVEKRSCARRTKSRGTRLDFWSAAVTKDECNAADGRFSTASKKWPPPFTGEAVGGGR